MNISEMIEKETIYSKCGQTFFRFEMDRLLAHQKHCSYCCTQAK